MAQYDPIVVKAGVPSAIGADTLHVDRVATTGMTTAAVTTGDVCQLNGANTLQKALYNSTAPVVGIYDGVSGSLVRSGVVIATFINGLTLLNGDTVYVSTEAGKLTNIKPASSNVHEVGIVIEAAASRILLMLRHPCVTLP